MTSNNLQDATTLPLGPSFLDAQPLVLQAGVLRAAKERIEAGEAEFPAPYQRDQTALLVAASGEFDAESNANLVKLTRMLWEGLGFTWAMVGFAGSAWPPLAVSLQHSGLLGLRHIIVFPCLLLPDDHLPGIHKLTDVFRAEHPQVSLVIAPHLGAQPVQRELQAENGAGRLNCLGCRYRPASVHGDASPAKSTLGKHR